MEVLDTSIANVSLEYIAGGLAISNDQATWVLTSYLVANAIVIPISGWLSDTIGAQTLFPDIDRTVHDLVLHLRDRAEPQRPRDRADISGGSAAAVSPPSSNRCSPTRSRPPSADSPSPRSRSWWSWDRCSGRRWAGYITEFYSWHWVFLINVPVGIAALFAIETFVDEPEAVQQDRRRS